jgi:hypothetical protein
MGDLSGENRMGDHSGERIEWATSAGKNYIKRSRCQLESEHFEQHTYKKKGRTSRTAVIKTMMYGNPGLRKIALRK